MENRKHPSKYYTCRRWRMLEWLMNRGFEPVQTLPDPTNVKYKIWLFDNTEELQAAVEEYFEILKSNK